MTTVKSAYVMTDLEGVAGVDDWDPRRRDYAQHTKGVYERSEMQRLLTGEVNAAARGVDRPMAAGDRAPFRLSGADRDACDGLYSERLPRPLDEQGHSL